MGNLTDAVQVVTFTKPVQDSRGLEITYPFPDLDHLYKSKVSCPPFLMTQTDDFPSLVTTLATSLVTKERAQSSLT